ncbi:reverse transcriptase domain-containing protein, partial [Tanacetum coccineum]
DANSSINKVNGPSTSNFFDILNNVDEGDACGVSSSMGNQEEDQAVGHATVSKHTSPTWNEDFESDDEVDEVLFPQGNKFDDQCDIRLKAGLGNSFMNYFWASKLSISDLGPANRRILLAEGGTNEPVIGTNPEYDDSIWNSAPVIEKETLNVSSKNNNIDASSYMGSKSFVNVVTASKPNLKSNFRTLFNEARVENLDFVLPVENVLAAQNKFANSLVGFFVGKRVAFSLVQNYVTNTWAPCVRNHGGRMGFSRALIEVTAEKELKQEVKMVVPMLKGEGHTIERMRVEYEWKPPRCNECHMFGHGSESCPKCVVEPPVNTTATQKDGFSTVQNRKKKGKKNEFTQQRNDEGIKLKQPQPKYVWNMKKQSNSKDEVNVIKLKNHFAALQNQDDVFTSNDIGEPSMGKDKKIIIGNDPRDRRHLWADLGVHKMVARGLPWILLGDFNVSLNIEDSLRGSSLMNSAMRDFKDCVKHIGVLDINCSGMQYTWNLKLRGKGGTLKKLDRVMGNIEFIDMFSGAYAIFQPYRISDHSPTVNGHTMFQVVQKMRLLKNPLRKLLHNQGNLHDLVNRLCAELDEVQIAIDKDPFNEALRDEEAVYIQAFNEAKVDEERFL